MRAAAMSMWAWVMLASSNSKQSSGKQSVQFVGGSVTTPKVVRPGWVRMEVLFMKPRKWSDSEMAPLD